MIRYLLPLAATCMAFAIAPDAAAATKRALVIGIDTYQPTAPTATRGAAAAKGRGTWIDLDGCVNDATAMRDLLVAKYGFKAPDIVFIKNREATHDRILAELDAFTGRLESGDTAFFYYAGHGSQVTNSASPEDDKKDETIVPADAATGAKDIRDKELRLRFNRVLDKGAMLTAVFDSCHSGSITRGNKQRNLPPDPRDVADPTGFDQPSPEERGALVLSAALPHQTAGEAVDAHNIPHGAFTMALLQALRAAPADLPVDRLFLKVKAGLQSEGRPQEPVLAGNDARRSRPLLGDRAGQTSGRVSLAALRQTDLGDIELQGGLAMGLREGCELVRVGAAAGVKPVRLKVTAVDGLSKATARVVGGGSGAVAPGDLFEVDRWVIPNDAILRVWMPGAGRKLAEIRATATALAKLKGTPGITWVDDPSQTAPSHVLTADATGWKLVGPDGKAAALGPRPTVAAVTASLGATGAALRADVPVTLFVSLPPAAELGAVLTPWGKAKDNAVMLVDRPEQAHYHLVGREVDGRLEYAWWLPGRTDAETRDRVPLPVRTDWVPLAVDAKAPAQQLQAFAGRIGKLKAWLQIEVPGGEEGFPYRLALRRADDGGIKTTGKVMKGESYGLVLQADPAELNSVERRFVYVYAIDSYGNSTLLYPRRGMGGENALPADMSAGAPALIPLGPSKLFRVSPPYGLDTYVMLASHEVIPNPEALAFEGVRKPAPASGTRGAANGLLGMLLDAGGGTRGAKPYDAPASWSVQRVTVQSAEQ